MNEPRRTPPPRAFACARCGALNGADFGRCIRCGHPLTAAPPGAPAAGSGQRAQPGRFSLSSGEHHYWATKTLLWATLVIFAGQVLASMARGTGFPILSGGHPADALRFGAMQISLDAVREEPFRLLSAIFIHFGALHFVLNMMGLMNFARIAEPAVGSARFTIAYVVTGLVGYMATIAYSTVTGPGGITGGASGAIFGIMGLLLGWLIRKKHPAWKDFAIQAVLFSVLFGFGVNASKVGVMINNTAHVGGLLCGIVFGLIYGGSEGRPKSDIGSSVAAGICLVACLASLVLCQLSPRWRKLDRSLNSALTAPSIEAPAFVARSSMKDRLTTPRGGPV